MAITRRVFVKNLLALPMLPILFDPQRDLASTPLAGQTAASAGAQAGQVLAARPAGLAAVALPAGPGVRSGRSVMQGGDFAAGEHNGVAPRSDGRLALDDSIPRQGTQAAEGVYVSPPLAAEFAFNAAALAWLADVPEGTRLSWALRASDDRRSWGDWQPLAEDADLRWQAAERSSALAHVSGRYLQWQARLEGASGGASPSLAQVTVIYIDSADGPSVTERIVPPVGPQAAYGVDAPYIISRAAWGCLQPYSSPDWPPEYRPTQKLIIHHTADSNNYNDGAAAVRAIWQYHAVTREWGDIGYNFLVDRWGNIYEGRWGGDNVVAGHALCFNWGSSGIAVIGDFRTTAVPGPAVEALGRLLAWIAYRRDLDPYASSYFVDRTLGNLCSHRDVQYAAKPCDMTTECPGDYLYAQLNSLRGSMWGRYPDYGLGWLSHDTPQTLQTGQTVAVNVAVQNRGRLSWAAGGGNPVHLGYHWYRPDGTQYVQDPADDHRTALPGDVAYGQAVGLQALLTAPAAPGSYTLKWDMVHEGVTWFAWQGCAMLDVSVVVSQPMLAVAFGQMGFLADPVTAPAAQRLAIAEIRGAPLGWTVSVDQPWCQLSQTSGNTPASPLVFVDKSGLGPGRTYTATITISAPGAGNSPYTVPVRLVYSATPLSKTYMPVVVR